MKTLRNNGGLFLGFLSLFLVNTQAHANEEPRITITQRSQQIYEFKLTASEPGTIFIKLFTEKGKLLYKERHEYADEAKIPFNLSQLEEGKYRFVISNKALHQTQEIFISKLEEQDVAAFVKELDEDKVKVTVFRRDTPVSLSVIDEYGREYYQQKLVGKRNFSQIFDLADVKNRYLEFVIAGGKSEIRKVL